MAAGRRVSSDAISVLRRITSLRRARDLGGGGGLARALQADHHDRDRGRGVEVDRVGGGAERLDQLVVDDLDDHLTGGDRLHHLDADRALAQPVHEFAHHVEGDVGLEQGPADLARSGVDVGSGQRAAARQPVENAGQLVGQAFEHPNTDSARGRTALSGVGLRPHGTGRRVKFGSFRELPET